MSVEYDRAEALFGQFTIDRQAIELGLVMLFVTGITGYLALQIGHVPDVGPPETFGDGATGEATASTVWVVAEVAFAASILVLALIYKRLPEWIQDTIQMLIVAGVFMYAGIRAVQLDAIGVVLASVVGLIVGYKTLDHFKIWWVANNVLAVILAIFIGILLGYIFGVVGMLVALVGLTAYDHYFANKRTWMFTLGKVVLHARLPVLFIRPASWQLAWEDLLESFDFKDDGEDEDDEEDTDDLEDSETAWGLGTADLAFPAAFIAAVASSPNGVVATFGAGAVALLILGVLVACARLRFEMLTRGSGAGLPALSAGVLVPYAALFVVGSFL